MTNDIEPLKFGLDIAWKWFEFHAKQRQTIIQFSFTLIGALTGAIGYLFATKNFVITLLLCVFGLLLCVVFKGLDARNRHFINVGTELMSKVLSDIETNSERKIGIAVVQLSRGHPLPQITYRQAANIISAALSILSLR
jgi:hypothetical protein